MKTIDVVNPADNSVLETLVLKTAEELEVIVDKAWAARKKWRDTPIRERGDILYRFSDLILNKYKD